MTAKQEECGYSRRPGMAKHRYAVGDLVRVQGRISMRSVDDDQVNEKHLPGVYEITRLLPELASGQPQYQIRSFDNQACYDVQEVKLIALPLPPFT